MVLVATSNGYTMTDGKTTTLNFDTSKRLVSIEQRLSATKTVATAIEYASNGKISKVTDGLGDVYNFVWTDTLVQIQKGTTLVAEITLASQRVAQVKYSLSGETVDFAYDTNGQLVSAFGNASQQKVLFQYNSVGAISSVKNYVSKTSDVATDSHHFQYLLLQTRIASCRNSDVASNAYCTMAHMFAEDGELLSTAEVKQGVFKPLRYRTKLDFEKSAGALSDFAIGRFTFDNRDEVFTRYTITSDGLALSTPQQLFNNYVFSACVSVSASSIATNDGTQKLCLQLLDDDQILAEIPIDASQRDPALLCQNIVLSADFHLLKVRVLYQNINADVTVYNATLHTTMPGTQKQYVDVDTGLTQATEDDGTFTKTWYEQDYCTLQYNGGTIANVIFNAKDYALTLISRLQNPTAYNVWYNDGKNMLYQVDGVSLVYGGVSQPIDAITVCTLLPSHGKATFKYIVADPTGFVKIRNATSAILQGMVCEEFVNSNFQTAKVVDEHGISTVYTYDANGSVTKVVTTAPTGGLLNIEETSTYHDNNLLKTSRSKRYLTEYVHSYVYGTDYELTQQTQPNAQATNFAYTQDKEKLTSISSTLDGATSQNDVTYNGDLVDTLSDTRTLVDFDYDARNNVSQVKIGGATVLAKEIAYNQDGTTQSVATYGNGQKVKKYYDRFDRLVKVSDVTEDETVLVQYVYSDEEIDKESFDPATFSPTTSANSPLRVVVDHVAGITTWYTYDQLGRVCATENSTLSVSLERDDYNRLADVTMQISEQTVKGRYVYQDFQSNKLQQEWQQVVDVTPRMETTYTTDELGRIAQTTVLLGDQGYKTVYNYVPRQQKEWIPEGEVVYPTGSGSGANPTALDGYWRTATVGTTPFVQSVEHYSVDSNGETHTGDEEVEYDANGNITKYGNVTYEYDKLGRLIRENNPHEGIDKTTTWCYDISGNILSRTEYDYTTGDLTGITPTATFAYTYGSNWKDQLVSFNGQSIAYDDAGNPTTYKGASLSWTRGRLLASYKPVGKIRAITMRYDAQGRRCYKADPDPSVMSNCVYVYSGKNLIQESNTGINAYSTTYLYNSQGIIGFVHNGETYTYRKNLFGDIVAIYRGTTKFAEYLYDAYGDCKVYSPITDTYPTEDYFIGNINPFRYRGYYWDKDLQLYYIQGRYYDPQTGRFIQPANVSGLNPQAINGLNLYSFATNTLTEFNIKSILNNESFDNYGKTDLERKLLGIERRYKFDVSILSMMFSHIENGFSILKGAIDGYRKLNGLAEIKGLNTASKWLMHIGMAIGLLVDAHNNFSDEGLSKDQQWIGFAVDGAYTIASTALSYGVSVGVTALLSLIPGIGVFAVLGGAIISIGISLLVDWLVEEYGLLDSIKKEIWSW